MASPSPSTAEEHASSPLRPIAEDHAPTSPRQSLSLYSVRDALIRQEDTIVFCLIERARYPYNSPAYDPSYFGVAPGVEGMSLVEFFVRQSEEIDANVGRYQSLEEIPFFADNLPMPLVPHTFPQVLYHKSALVNVSKNIWEMYFNELLPLLTVKGDDGNYGSTVASDLVCLQALSRRIHYGRFVAEVKYRDAPQDYSLKIQAKGSTSPYMERENNDKFQTSLTSFPIMDFIQDRDALKKMLTFDAVEAAVKRRVEKKATLLGRDVTLDDQVDPKNRENAIVKGKIDPKVAGRLYEEWVMPLTKQVQVEYLLRRLD